ncbi:MAG TPA: PAS domain S-box protein [Kofleriaceae bacterium]|nr:PAS domain S-box protein [Kofleriaceae bacterium]
MSWDPHIVVVGGADDARVQMLKAMTQCGFGRVESCATVSLTEHMLLPDLLVVVGADVRSLCSQAREVPQLANVPILAVVPAIPAGEDTAALAAGADDVVVSPSPNVVLCARARNLARSGEFRAHAQVLDRLRRASARIQEHLAYGGDGPEGLREALLIACHALRFDRASIIASVESSATAYVIAATDDPTLSKFTLLIDDYPELREAMGRGEPLLIDDCLSHPVTQSVSELMAERGVRGVAVFPVTAGRGSLGAVLFRRQLPGVSDVDPFLIDFGKLFAAQIAAQLGHGKVIQRLKDQTGRISRARYEVERRLRMIDSLKEHFEAAANGVVVLDEGGHILFVNKTAERITGFARDGLVGTPLLDMVPSLQAEALQEVIRSVLGGVNLEAFDLDLSTTAADAICVSVTTSTVLASSGAVILSFRDVTAQRALETELRKTKEFLEKLIDSTVDAIVAADIHGMVILFNQGAERIYGFSAEDVVGHMKVSELYPDGVALQVMRMLRSVSYGGVGRLEQTRREIRNKSGDLVPVNMTASIIYEDEREVATVGIFSDLRDRIRIEQRLLQAQEKLQLSEKQALVAELAGAAAHELNQPLTSIIGYAQLIERQSEVDAPHLRAVNVILREGDRMAEIVKKIGRITKFETKEYVGQATILDLDKSASVSSPELVLPDPDAAVEPDLQAAASDDETSTADGRAPGPEIEDASEDASEDANADGVEPSDEGAVEEPTVVGHRARLFELDGIEPESDETLDELELEQALDNDPRTRAEVGPAKERS